MQNFPQGKAPLTPGTVIKAEGDASSPISQNPTAAAIDLSKLSKEQQEEAIKTFKTAANATPDTGANKSDNGPSQEYLASVFHKLNEAEKALHGPQGQEEVKEPEKVSNPEPKKFCQHCGWDLGKSDIPEPSEADRLNFVQSILGQIPFKKEYSLLNGNLIVWFKTLTGEEQDLAVTQVTLDSQKDLITTEDQYYRTLMDYRLCLAIHKVKLGNLSQIALPDTLAEWKIQRETGQTILKKIVPHVYSNILKTESIRRAVATSYFRFQQFVEHMEAKFDDPNFWPKIVK